MRSVRFLLAIALVLNAAAALAATRTIRIFDKKQVVIGVPEGWKYNLTMNKQTGVQTLQLEDRDSDAKLTASFFPDPENSLETEAALEGRMRDLFAADIAYETKFTIEKTADGLAGHTVIGNATKGVRSWPGVFVVFTLTADDRESEAYAKGLEAVKAGIREVAK
jgi:hypothetical protein